MAAGDRGARGRTSRPTRPAEFTTRDPRPACGTTRRCGASPGGARTTSTARLLDFPEREYDLGLFTVDHRLKPAGQAVAEVMKRARAGDRPAAGRPGLVAPDDLRSPGPGPDPLRPGQRLPPRVGPAAQPGSGGDRLGRAGPRPGSPERSRDRRRGRPGRAAGPALGPGGRGAPAGGERRDPQPGPALGCADGRSAGGPAAGGASRRAAPARALPRRHPAGRAGGYGGVAGRARRHPRRPPPCTGAHAAGGPGPPWPACCSGCSAWPTCAADAATPPPSDPGPRVGSRTSAQGSTAYASMLTRGGRGWPG